MSVFYVISMQNSTKAKPKKNYTPSGGEISVYFTEEDKVKNMPLEEYICGVVSAEMPASFENEALKAQAVAARSYAIYRTRNKNPDHPDAAVCTDYTHCKAYMPRSKANEKWGEDAKKYSERIENAVYATKGEVITYNGEVALAVFHSQSGGGRTENSKDVWGGNVPYLVSVESHGEENAPNFYSTAVFSFNEFKEKIHSKFPNAVINSYKDIGRTEKSEGGSVKTIEIGGVKISGKDIRTLFSLRSSCFRIRADETTVTFEVTGYGHGVGMSQYGANTMAKEGYSYVDILTHYYSGTKVDGV
ncbi:MAG: stage II sporulation protein D [Clostridia bacterium]|nr:stage II sporulation protein D [Clostridia bacterium]